MQTYLLKLSRSGEDGEKVFLLLESGTRLHTTEASRVSSPLSPAGCQWKFGADRLDVLMHQPACTCFSLLLCRVMMRIVQQTV